MHKNIEIHKYSSLEDSTRHLLILNQLTLSTRQYKYANTETQSDNSRPDTNILSGIIFPLATLYPVAVHLVDTAKFESSI